MFSDGFYQTQVMSLIGLIYVDKEKATLGFALYQFIHSFASAVMFYAGSFVPMFYQMIISSIQLIIGCGLNNNTNLNYLD